MGINFLTIETLIGGVRAPPMGFFPLEFLEHFPLGFLIYVLYIYIYIYA